MFPFSAAFQIEMSGALAVGGSGVATSATGLTGFASTGVGADVNAKTDAGRTPLDAAIQFKEAEAADLLRKHGGKYGSIHTAAAGGDTEAVKEFLAAGADVNAKTDAGRTPLDAAIQFKEAETADLLRKHGGKTGEELKAEGK